jgi:hypothetical protein
MATRERVYRRTASGLKAVQAEEPALAPEYLRILAIIGEEMHWDMVRTVLRRHADHARLAELEAQGLIAAEAAPTEEHSLDFTGSFSFAR